MIYINNNNSKVLRPLSSVEKRFLGNSLESETRHGSVCSGKWVSNSLDISDDATLLSSKDKPLTISLVSRALKILISNHIEMFTTINKNSEFQLLDKINTSDVLHSICFENKKDELVNCHSGAPPYLINYIFSLPYFQPDSKKPLWQLFIVNSSLVVFYGDDTLFDIFAVANFIKLLFEIINSLPYENKEIQDDIIFKLPNIRNISKINFPKSIYDNPMLHLPATKPELFNLQTQSFFKSIYLNTFKKSFDYLNFTQQTPIILARNHNISKNYNEILHLNSIVKSELVTGNVSMERYLQLLKLIDAEKIDLKSFFCSIIIMCLKFMITCFDGSIIFKIPYNLRSMQNLRDKENHNSSSGPEDSANELGIIYKDIYVEVPLKLIEKIGNEDVVEEQFKIVCNYINESIQKRIKAWEKNGFNDDDIKRMKFGYEQVGNIIEVNDLTSLDLSCSKDSLFHIEDLSLTRNLKKNQILSLSFASNNYNGLNLCINYSTEYKMKDFIDCFQSFMEN
ncbi:hypothetical protein TBLA_0A07220 [Henningerozyma blattae CBS 6284]|uniref:Alcohol acetyltransferase n=1 Tax=Henningerozyma blattae (strain ATCC 34711 / CBS 6284 / DSM 70876 / NBRC 10599 / NRRL Y-10934 / UCD 77-7) TaxID=1071380 RepID=I2GWL0_HENB6|nr:hypothetical protein TBLA_0A07220 [Tetrapisispora blattae CBS 6284]CCH58512.1 hypothetical protein TBLA_0A07220 [Tetrapisispora blattae CBS 6284]